MVLLSIPEALLSSVTQVLLVLVLFLLQREVLSCMCWGHGSDHQCQKRRHMNTGRSRQGSLLLQRGAGAPKSVCAEQRTLPYFSLTQVMDLSPSHWSSQGAHSSWLVHLEQIVPQGRGKGEGGGRRKAKPEQSGVPRLPLIERTLLLCMHVLR